jgi:uncharacterized repeat protein (TIGR03803 family)
LAIASPAQTFTVVKRFNGTNGAYPLSVPTEGLDGNLYGTATFGGAYNNNGVVYKLTPAGTYSRIHNFCAVSGCPDGAAPLGGVTQATDGWLYGSAWAGGAYNNGTTYRINTNGKLETLNSFCAQTNCTDGAQPQSPQIQGWDGWLYGTSLQGGAYGQYGTIFRTGYGDYSQRLVLYSFCAVAGCADGDSPHGPLIQATDGAFYGTTQVDGVYGQGTVFQYNPNTMTLTTLYSFCALPGCTDGSNPWGGVIQGLDGNFYGTTSAGGPSSTACGIGCGTIFQLTIDGVLTTLHTFNSSDGKDPVGLIQASDGSFYGVTAEGGAHNKGTIFQLTPKGTFTTLHSFAYSDGTAPGAGLMQKTDGNFYGTASAGGNSTNDGTIFSLSMGLPAFVKTMPNAAAWEYGFDIVGTNLTGTTSVTLNGVPCSFTVASPTLIYAAVPVGATSGLVVVTTPSGTLTSNVLFQVLP